MSVLKSAFVASVLFFVTALSASAQANLTTAHNDNARTGLNPNETNLTPVTVSSNGFGKLFSRPVDGPIYAQPLYVSGITIPGKGVHNVVYVATMHDSLYAFDADSASGSNAAPLWHVSFINPAAGTNAPVTLDASDGGDCRTFVGEIGIVGTPVIDLPSQTIYLVARTKDRLPPPNNTTVLQFHRLHALDLATGNERPGSPVIVDGVVPGTGVGSTGGQLPFDQKRHIQRPALLLVNGVVYVSFCSYCDYTPYHGWIMGYNAQTLQQVGVFNVSPNSTKGGIWMGGAGLAADPEGGIYCITGDGPFDTGANPQNFGDSFLKLVQTTSLALADYFTPHDQGNMYAADNDLGSSGAVVLPDSVGSAAHPHLLVGCGKVGMLYLVDRDNMGHFNALNDSQIVQSFSMFSLQPGAPHFFGSPAFYKDRLYIQGVGEYLKAYAFSNGQLNTTPVTQAAETLGFRGGTPSISANGTTNGIVWQVAPLNTLAPSLRAYNAENLSQVLYDSYLSTQAGWPDALNYVKFVVPTIANGKVYLGTVDSLAVFGLRSFIKSATRNPANGMLHLVYTAPVGIPTYVQVSEDFSIWSNVGSGTLQANGTFVFDTPIDPASPPRFYRVR